MDYEHYEVENFLMDDSFLNYCLERNEKDVRFWQQWIKAHPEKGALVQQAKELYFVLNGNITSQQLQKDEQQFRAIAEKHMAATRHEEPVLLNPPPTRSSRIRSILLYTGLAAAAILAVIILPNKLQPKTNTQPNSYTHTSNAGERKSFQLPDGSKVTLNAGSTITLSASFNEQARELTLQGEAFFDVTHNTAKPFIIHTNSMDVKVLGTVFNVKAYPNDKVTETALLKGMVEVTVHNTSNKKIILHPNQKIILPNEEVTHAATQAPSKKEPAKDTGYTIAALTYSTTDSSLVEVSWTQNKLVFNDNSFEEIAAQLERWYNVTIRFNNDEVKQYRFTANFDQKNITQVLDALKWSRPFKYTINENNVIQIE
jgi:ferric-dicitrate binding protein FerR (iron transport regulator)